MYPRCPVEVGRPTVQREELQYSKHFRGLLSEEGKALSTEYDTAAGHVQASSHFTLSGHHLCVSV